MSQGIGAERPPDLTEEDIHDVLRNKRRRLVIDILQESEEPVSVRDLSEEIGAVISGRDPPPRNVKQSVYVSLLQTHLPKLDDLGIVDYESERKMVKVSAGLEDVTVYLETVPPFGITRSEYYTGMALLALLTVYAAAIGVPVVAAVTPLTWSIGFFLLILASGLFHVTRQRTTVVHRLFDL